MRGLRARQGEAWVEGPSFGSEVSASAAFCPGCAGVIGLSRLWYTVAWRSLDPVVDH